MIVLDTNVVSELMRPAPDPRVLTWLRRVPAREITTSAISLAEIYFGLERLPAGRRKRTLVAAAQQVFEGFADAVVAFDAAAARRYGAVVSRRERSGQPISVLDAQIAAICLSRDATLATHNIGEFAGLRLALVDPWRAR